MAEKSEIAGKLFNINGDGPGTLLLDPDFKLQRDLWLEITLEDARNNQRELVRLNKQLKAVSLRIQARYPDGTWDIAEGGGRDNWYTPDNFISEDDFYIPSIQRNTLAMRTNIICAGDTPTNANDEVIEGLEYLGARISYSIAFSDATQSFKEEYKLKLKKGHRLIFHDLGGVIQTLVMEAQRKGANSVTKGTLAIFTSVKSAGKARKEVSICDRSICVHIGVRWAFEGCAIVGGRAITTDHANGDTDDARFINNRITNGTVQGQNRR